MLIPDMVLHRVVVEEALSTLLAIQLFEFGAPPLHQVLFDGEHR